MEAGSVDSILKCKSTDFAKRIVALYRYLSCEHKGFVIAKQILRSGTSIGANVTEAIYGSSRKDFVAKLQIAKKEAAETLYWLELLFCSDYLPKRLYESLEKDCNQLLAMISSTIQSTMK